MTPGREDVSSPSQEEGGGDSWRDSQGLLPDHDAARFGTGAAALGADGPASTDAAVHGATSAPAKAPGSVSATERSPFAQVARLQEDGAGRPGEPDQAAAGHRPAATPRTPRHIRARTPRRASQHLAEEPAAARVSLDGECVTPRRGSASDAVFAWTGVDLVGAHPSASLLASCIRPSLQHMTCRVHSHVRQATCKDVLHKQLMEMCMLSLLSGQAKQWSLPSPPRTPRTPRMSQFGSAALADVDESQPLLHHAEVESRAQLLYLHVVVLPVQHFISSQLANCVPV